MSQRATPARLLGAVLVAAFASVAEGQRATDSSELEVASREVPQKERGWIYYDYLENGELKGGVVPVDPTNPLHTSIGEALSAASPFVTLVQNGPSSNRIDLVFVGDGYQDTELDIYAAQVDAIYPDVLLEPPFDGYATYFNVHRVDVVSVDSGVDNDPVQGIQRNTALDMGFWCGGTQRLLCVNVSKANAQANSAPDVDSILAVAHSTTYGGAGYTDLATLAGGNSATVELALHEFGHAFADLADEYDYGGPTNWQGGEPSEQNVSTYDEATMASLQKKWHRWLGHPNVSTYEGAKYSRFGIYRPTFDSKMRNLYRPYEEVNSEQIIRDIYRIVKPIDDATPSGIYLGQHVFFVDPVDPADHALSIEWSLDGASIPGANGETLDPSSLGLSPGAYTLSVTVRDDTPLVIRPGFRSQWLTESRSWTIAVPGGATRFHKGPLLPGGVIVP